MLQKIKDLLKILLKRKIVVHLEVSYDLPNERFKGKKVLVTGGSSGIGLAIAKSFLAEGAEVLICARKEAQLLEVVGELKSDRLHAMEWDVSAISNIPNKLLAADDILHGIDVFVNAAGVSAYNEDLQTEKMYDYICDINQKGLYYMNMYEGDYLIDRKIKGKIVNITSKAGERIGFDPYTLSKWGANSITMGNARRLAPYQINVNGVAPGRTPTNITKELQSHINSDNVYSNTSTMRFTMPEEIAAIVLFLAGQSANNIVGQIIAIDGGSYENTSTELVRTAWGG